MFLGRCSIPYAVVLELRHEIDLCVTGLQEGGVVPDDVKRNVADQAHHHRAHISDN